MLVKLAGIPGKTISKTIAEGFTENFDSLKTYLKPKRIWLRTLIKMNHALPDPKEHPFKARLARTAISGIHEAATTAKNHPYITAGVAGGAVGGLTVRHFMKKRKD